ncbi:MAG TPA: heme o synthase [Rhodanobacteraceae bacterium]|nr:heme o synthase [Rhodanobacteraceae bacterium]
MTVHFAEYWELTKPRIVALLVFCAVIGMFLAVNVAPPAVGVPGWQPLVFGTLGIWLASSSAAAFNHLIDRRIDKVMSRTSHRPLASGKLTARQVFVFAVVIGVVSMLILALLVNVLTAVLTFAGLIGYALIYTAFLKRATSQNIVIGGLAGAIPPILGWTAVTGQLDPYALLLCLIIFVWTPPHFWALAIFRREEYARADIPMLPVTHGVRYTAWNVLFYTVLLLVVTVLPFLTGMSGLLYLGGALVLGGGFLYYAIRLIRPPDERFAMKVFGYSIVYLMVLFAFLLLDHWLVMPAFQVARLPLAYMG